MKIAIPKRLRRKRPAADVAGYPVGTHQPRGRHQALPGNDNWAQLRFSGTEPVLRWRWKRIARKGRELIAWLKRSSPQKKKNRPAAEDPCVTLFRQQKNANM